MQLISEGSRFNWLDTWWNLGTQPHRQVPGDLWVKTSKTQLITPRGWGCPLNNVSRSWSRGSRKKSESIGIGQSLNWGFVILESWIKFLMEQTKHLQKFHFPWIVFPKYDNFKKISTDNIFLSICVELHEWGLIMRERKFYKLYC